MFLTDILLLLFLILKIIYRVVHIASDFKFTSKGKGTVLLHASLFSKLLLYLYMNI